MIDPLQAILIALVHGIDADVARQAMRCWRLAYGDRYARGLGAIPNETLLAIGLAGPEVVQMRGRDLRETCEAIIAKQLEGSPQRTLVAGPERVSCRLSVAASNATSAGP